MLNLKRIIPPLVLFTLFANAGCAPRSGDNSVTETSIQSSTTTIQMGQYNLYRDNGRALRWDTCAGPINVAANLGNSSSSFRNEAVRAISSAIGEISDQSGLPLIYAGSTSQVPELNRERNDRIGSSALLIAFLPSGTGLLVNGRNGSVVVQSSSRLRSDSWSEILTFDVQVNSESIFSINDIEPFVKRGLLYAIGLDGVDSRNEVMGKDSLGFPSLLREFGPGDLLGMKTVGTTQGCFE